MNSDAGVVVAVPDWNVDELNSLSERLAESGGHVRVRAFNGETFATLLLILTPTTTPVLVAWVKAMAERRKAYKLDIRGMTLQGYSPSEVERVIHVLEGYSAGGLGSDEVLAPPADSNHSSDG